VIGRVDAVEPQLVVLVPYRARLRERAQPERTQAQLLVYAPMLIGVDPGLVDAAASSFDLLTCRYRQSPSSYRSGLLVFLTRLKFWMVLSVRTLIVRALAFPLLAVLVPYLGPAAGYT
jgi:hypothetical protein